VGTRSNIRWDRRAKEYGMPHITKHERNFGFPGDSQGPHFTELMANRWSLFVQEQAEFLLYLGKTPNNKGGRIQYCYYQHRNVKNYWQSQTARHPGIRKAFQTWTDEVDSLFEKLWEAKNISDETYVSPFDGKVK